MQIAEKQKIIKTELKNLPEEFLDMVMHYIQFLKYQKINSKDSQEIKRYASQEEFEKALLHTTINYEKVWEALA